jgi:hypothetical protein
VPLQVLEENRGKDLAESLAEYNRVRKPDMDALRHFDTISTRIWGGKLVFHRESPLTHRLHATSSPAAAAPWAAVRCWPSEKSKFGLPFRCRNRLAGWLQAAGSPSGTSTGRTSAPRPTSWCPARCTGCCPECGLPPPCWWVHPASGRPQETSSLCGASHDLAPVILTSPKLFNISLSLIADRIHARGYQIQASTTLGTTSVLVVRMWRACMQTCWHHLANLSCCALRHTAYLQPHTVVPAAGPGHPGLCRHCSHRPLHQGYGIDGWRMSSGPVAATSCVQLQRSSPAGWACLRASGKHQGLPSLRSCSQAAEGLS